jgi:hypothetical protein
MTKAHEFLCGSDISGTFYDPDLYKLQIPEQPKVEKPIPYDNASAHLSIYLSMALQIIVEPWLLFTFLIFTQSVGLL